MVMVGEREVGFRRALFTTNTLTWSFPARARPSLAVNKHTRGPPHQVHTWEITPGTYVGLMLGTYMGITPGTFVGIMLGTYMGIMLGTYVGIMPGTYMGTTPGTYTGLTPAWDNSHLQHPAGPR